MSIPLSPQKFTLSQFPNHFHRLGRLPSVSERFHASIELDSADWQPLYRSSIYSSTQLPPMYTVLNPSGNSYRPYPHSASPPMYVTTGTSSTMSSPDNSSQISSLDQQVESTIGPSRVTTRGHRAFGRSHISQSTFSNERFSTSPPSSRSSSDAYIAPPDYRPASQATAHFSGSGNPSLVSDHVSMTMASPRKSSQSLSPSPSMDISAYNVYTRSPRSDSISDTPSHSPSVSIMISQPSPLKSAPQSLPSTDNLCTIAHPRVKHRKQRLFNVDRRAICQYHADNPTARQEDIAMRYGVERSTISKILKNKSKWLNVPQDDLMRVAKHRPSKFPEVEEHMVQWLAEPSAKAMTLSDNYLRAKARAIARHLGIPDDKFKASSGWIENFKHRHGIKGGQWLGDGKNTNSARAIGAGEGSLPASVPEDDDDMSSSVSSLTPYTPQESHDDTSPRSYPPSPDTSRGDVHSNHTFQHAMGGSEVTSPDTMMAEDLSPASPPSPRVIEQYHLAETHHTSMLQHCHSPQTADHSQSALEIDSMNATSEATQGPVTYDHPQIYSDGLEIYQALPSLPDRTMITTVGEAEAHLDKILMFLDTVGKGTVDKEDLAALRNVKKRLLYAGNGGM